MRTKTLDQIWEENFEFLTPEQANIDIASCGNGQGGDPADNQKSPMDTLADKIAAILNDPAMSEAAKQAKIQQLLNNFFNPPPQGIGPIAPGPTPGGPIAYPGNINPTRPGNTDPTNGPIPPPPGLPEFPDIQPDIGGRINLDIDNDGNVDVRLEPILPDAAKTAKQVLHAAVAKINGPCKNNKSGSNDPSGGSGSGEPTPPTPTTPLVPPPTTPPVTTVPFRPVTPPGARPGAGVIGGRPVQ